MQMPYRADIDGLRAIAVLVVLFFHFEVPGFAGGFIGVDVFFVISGYLITQLIRREVDETGTFDFRRFYVRRFWRLYPALLVTLLASFIAAAIVFSPQHLSRFGPELGSAMFSVSNILFWAESGYFDTEALFKPLLHTWSLSVEWQFYLVWPLLLLLVIQLARGAGAPLILLGIGAVSLCASEMVVSSDASAAFFLTPFRVFEFAAGAVLVWLPLNRVERWTAELLCITGIALIASGTMLFSGDTIFPGVNALLPVLGTALAIAGGAQSRIVGALIKSRPFTWTGETSYSLYLCHWPLFVFYQYAIFAPGGLLQTSMLLALSFLLAALMYYFIEKPFRSTRGAQKAAPGRKFATLSIAATLALLPSMHAYATNGWEWRISEAARMLARSAAEPNARSDELCHYRSARADNEFFSRLDACTKTEGPAVLVLGDSHGLDLFNALANNAKYTHIAGLVQGGCRPHRHRPECQYKEAAKMLRSRPDDFSAVVYTQKGSYFLKSRNSGPIRQGRIETVREYLDGLAQHVEPILWAGPQWEPNVDVDKPVLFVSTVERELAENLDQKIIDVDAAISSEIEESKIEYVSKLDAVGPLTLDKLIVDGRFTYSDRDHWSAHGERFFGKLLLANAPALRRLLGVKEIEGPSAASASAAIGH